MKPITTAAGLTMSAVLLLAGCTASSDGTAPADDTTADGAAATLSEDEQAQTTAGTLTLAVGTEVDSLDPAAQVTSSVMQRVMMMVESLTRINSDGEVEPLLATSWEPSNEGATYTFQLREGVTFSDGAPLTADAVKFNFDRLFSEDTVNASPNVLAVIESVEVIDDLTVAFHLEEPFPALPAALSMPWGGVLSPDSVDVAPNTPEQIEEPVGTGPYVFEEFVPGDHLTLRANEDYWGEDKPVYETQVYQIVPEASSRIALLRSGQADVIVDPPVSELEALQADDSVNVLLVDSAYNLQILFNTQAPELQDPDVRKAISHAIDRESLIENVVFGAASPLEGPITSVTAGSCPVGNYEYDPELAKEMLAEAGASDLTLQMGAPSGRYLNDYTVAEAVAGQLRAVGLNVELANPPDFPTYLSEVYTTPEETPYDVRMMGWGALYADASQALLQFRGDYLPPEGYNGTYYENEEYDELVDLGNAEPDQEERQEIYCEAQEMLLDDAPSVWLYGQRNAIVTSDDVTGLIGLPNNIFVSSFARPAS